VPRTPNPVLKQANADAHALLRPVLTRLAARRRALGLSQAAVGARMGVQQGYVSRIESIHQHTTLPMVLAYAAAVGVGVTVVLAEPPEPEV
jgi:transcriptional regulator with XRE-family HTH domain